MHLRKDNQKIPVYSLEPDEATGNKQFRVYTYEGGFPTPSDLLVAHRKDHYLLVFIKQAGGRQWIDTRFFRCLLF